ncbi:hypothetical protein GPALN_009767 [Globodera pallida]|nr:hypothetical protein GPALN_009766 [Globodera pallida]KAI3418441.1 hypothetical protein GPALN_009767 [Globodera pallida]
MSYFCHAEVLNFHILSYIGASFVPIAPPRLRLPTRASTIGNSDGDEADVGPALPPLGLESQKSLLSTDQRFYTGEL